MHWCGVEFQIALIYNCPAAVHMGVQRDKRNKVSEAI